MLLQGSNLRLQGGKGISLQNTGRPSGSSLKMGKALQPTITNGQLNRTKTISKPKKHTTNSAPAAPPYQQNVGSGYATGGGGGYAAPAAPAAPAYDPKVVKQIDQSIGILNDSLKRIGVQSGIAKGNVNRQYRTNKNELNTSKSQSTNKFKQSTLQNQQNNRTNKNAILDQQSAGLRGLLSMLGAYGAVGSDLKVASGAVADDASMKRSGASQTFAQNQQGLDTNFNNFLADWKNSDRKLNDWKDQQLDSVESQALSNKQDLLTRLADFRGQRAAAMGGDYAGGAAGSLSQARGLSGRIDGLGRINPSYNGKTPTYNAPTLDSYAAPQAAQAAMGGVGNTAANPFLTLLGLDQQDDRQLGY